MEVGKIEEKVNKNVVFIIIFICIILRFIYFTYLYGNKYHEEKGNFTVMVIQNTKYKADMQTYEVFLKEGKKTFKDKFLLNVYVEGNKKLLKYGDVVTVQGVLKVPESLGNPYEFNYKRYLNSKKIFGTISAFGVNKIGTYNKNFIYKLSYNIRDFLNLKMDKFLTKTEGNLLKSMLYGDTRFLDESLLESFEAIGITHLLAVSGSNVATVVLITYFIFNKMKLNRNLSNIYMLFFIATFTIISKCELSIVRASIMCGIMIFSDILGRKYNIWSSIITSFVLIILYNPYSIFNVGMQLSFAATMGIVMYYKYVKKIFNDFIVNKIKNAKLQFFIEKVLDLLAVTVSAFILILPLQFYYFNSFNPVMFISNILAVFLADIICNIGFASLFISFIPVINFFVINSIGIILKLLILVSEGLTFFKFLNINIKSPNILLIITYYFFVLTLYIYLKSKEEKWLKVWKTSLKMLIILICLTIVYNIYFDNYIIFFNVGQGDCSLIKFYSKIIVIDSGSTKNLAGGVLSNFLKNNGITKIDLFFISHAHDDHFNGILNLEEIKIGRIVYTREDLLKVLEENNLDYIPKWQVIKGDKIKISKEFKIKVLSPSYFEIKDKDPTNANSMVLEVNVENKKIMYMGDATESAEKLLLKTKLSKVDILKVGHHGSATSSSEEFIKKISPKIAVISSEKKVHNHPNKKVVDLFKSRNIKIHITEYKSYLKVKI